MCWSRIRKLAMNSAGRRALRRRILYKCYLGCSPVKYSPRMPPEEDVKVMFRILVFYTRIDLLFKCLRHLPCLLFGSAKVRSCSGCVRWREAGSSDRTCLMGVLKSRFLKISTRNVLLFVFLLLVLTVSILRDFPAFREDA